MKLSLISYSFCIEHTNEIILSNIYDLQLHLHKEILSSFFLDCSSLLQLTAQWNETRRMFSVHYVHWPNILWHECIQCLHNKMKVQDNRYNIIWINNNNWIGEAFGILKCLRNKSTFIVVSNCSYISTLMLNLACRYDHIQKENHISNIAYSVSK